MSAAAATARRGGPPAGFALALASALSFGLMGWLVRAGREHLPSGELVFLRGLASLIVLTPLAWRRIALLTTWRARFLWLRSGFGALSMLCFYWNLQHTSVGTARAFSDLAPVFVALFSWRLLGERLGAREGLGVALAVAGALLLEGPADGALPLRVTLTGLGGALMASGAYLSLRRAAVEFSPELVVWCLSGVSCLAALATGTGDWALPSGSGFPITIGVALFGLAGQLLMTRAYVSLSASVASTLGLTALLWGVLFEIAFDGRRPGWPEWAAYLLVVVGAMLLHGGPPAQPAVAPPPMPVEPGVQRR